MLGGIIAAPQHHQGADLASGQMLPDAGSDFFRARPVTKMQRRMGQAGMGGSVGGVDRQGSLKIRHPRHPGA